jgi:hypothetical protein
MRRSTVLTISIIVCVPWYGASLNASVLGWAMDKIQLTTQPGLSLQLKRWPCIWHALVLLLSKTAQLKAENLAQAT